MAKIEVSALLNAIRGRLGGAVYVQSKGINYVRLVSESTLDPKTARSVQVRANLNTAAKGFPPLTSGQKDLWREYANLKQFRGGARAAYIALSCNLLNASHSDLVVQPSPPSVPGTPRFPKHFCVTWMNSYTNCLSWLEPADVDTWVTGHFRVHRGICVLHPCFDTCKTGRYGTGTRIVGTERADTLAIQHVHDYPHNTRLYYRLNSIDRCGRKSPFTHELCLTTFLCKELYIADRWNHRILVWCRQDFRYIKKIGTQGAGDDQFEYPAGVAVDATYFYVSDSSNHRIVKRRKSDMCFVAKIGTEGSGDDQFEFPRALAVDDTYLYICDTNNHRIVKRLKSDLSFVKKVGTFGTGNNQFKYPYGITVDDQFIYICDTNNHRIVKRRKFSLAYNSKFGAYGSGDDQFDSPQGIAVNATYLFIADQLNDRLKKHLKSDLSYHSKIGTSGQGNDNFSYPSGVALGLTKVYVGDTEGIYGSNPNHRIHRRLQSDLSFEAVQGTWGTGNIQLKHPANLSIQTQYS